MASLATCPHCRQAITLSVDVIADQRFLCPHCHGEFAVEDAVTEQNHAPAEPNSGEPTSSQRLQIEYVSDAAERLKALPTAGLQRRSRRTGWLSQWIGVIGGGVIGLTIGYCILLRLRGAEADFLQIADRLPAWATGLPSKPNERESPIAPALSDVVDPSDENLSDEADEQEAKP